MGRNEAFWAVTGRQLQLAKALLHNIFRHQPSRANTPDKELITRRSRCGSPAPKQPRIGMEAGDYELVGGHWCMPRTSTQRP